MNGTAFPKKKERKKERKKKKTARRYFSLERIVSITISLSRSEGRAEESIRGEIAWSLLYRCGNFTTGRTITILSLSEGRISEGEKKKKKKKSGTSRARPPSLAAFSIGRRETNWPRSRYYRFVIFVSIVVANDRHPPSFQPLCRPDQRVEQPPSFQGRRKSKDDTLSGGTLVTWTRMQLVRRSGGNIIWHRENALDKAGGASVLY